MKNIIHFIIMMAILPIQAQVVEDFSDGNLTENPAWSGATNHFRVNTEYQLQLFTTGSGTAAITTQSHLIDSTEWRFWIRLAFSPSSNNFARVYLVADQTDLTGPLNGYYLQFGESGSGDAIELFGQSGLSSWSVCRGTGGMIAGSFSMNIKVSYLINGEWRIYALPEGGSVYQLEASGSDFPQMDPLFFGISCTYTSSNSQKFFFDNLLITPIEQDTVAPRIERITALAGDHLVIRFSEQVNETDATNPLHYFVESDGRLPVAAAIHTMDPNSVSLFFTQPFINGTSDFLHILNIRDLAGNLLQEAVEPFTFYIPQPYDVVINEIMADPDPAIGLPPVEYIELYNASGWSVSLKDWALLIAGSAKVFPEVIVPSGGFLLLTKGDDLQELGSFVPVFTSTHSLSNDGTNLMLLDASGHLIHAVDYSINWCTDDWKKDGGWSLEMMDPYNPCGEATNWSVCVDAAGGSPGQVNSIWKVNPDTVAPRLYRIGMESADRIRLWLSEKTDSLSLLHPMNYFIEPDIGCPEQATAGGDSYRSVKLRLAVPAETATTYKLILTGPVLDCAGNPSESGAWLPFGIPSSAGCSDVVINEIMLDPPADGVDFIEIYNRSDRFIDLKEMVLAQWDTISLALLSVKPVSGESFIMAPGQYKVLTTNPSWVISHYHCPDPDAFISMASWVPFNKESSVIVLARAHDQLIIDRVHYKESLHFDLISNPEGVSLERIHSDRPSEDPTNWHSASQTSGFATPGYQNSQFATVSPMADEWMSVHPQIFSPDNDGSDDILTIRCTAGQPGTVLNMQVFDPEGRRIRNLVNNSLMGLTNVYSWDGTNEEGKLMPAGIYVIWAQAFDLSGNAKKSRCACVLVHQCR